MIDLIKERAYLLWEESGRPEGRSEEFWLKAEQEFETIDFVGLDSSNSEVVEIEMTSCWKRVKDFVMGCSWLGPFA